VQLDYQDFFSTSDFRSGIGVGLRYRLPIGPIRVDYAVNPDPHDSESRSVLHFTVGMAF
jgi:outer membrane translocation and assembly module TamA